MKLEIQERRYLHFDRPFFGDVALAMVSDPDRVARWSFMHFLHIDLEKVRVKRQVDGSLVPDTKKRPIYYASHKDAALYFYYSEKLGSIYESLLDRLGISECVTAFRKSRGMCNIHFAHEVFQEIGKHEQCTVHTFDVSSFFENLDHKILKRLWERLLGTQGLPVDHYSIFKSITRYSYVDRVAAFLAFEISSPEGGAFKRRHICEADEFRERIRDAGLIHRHTDSNSAEWETKGIPQGSPISALLSNLYMMDFDLAVAAAVRNLGGIYRRYCDDIVCVVPDGSGVDIEALIKVEIAKLKLEIHSTKSTIHQFRRVNGALVCKEQRPVQYLGFLFDGKSIRLRTVALSRYYAKMRRGVRAVDRARKGADLEAGTQTKMRTKAVHRRYTYLGRRNFLSYAHRAAEIMGSKAIRKQLKPHLARFTSYVQMKDDHWLRRSAISFESLRVWYLSRKG